MYSSLRRFSRTLEANSRRMCGRQISLSAAEAAPPSICVAVCSPGCSGIRWPCLALCARSARRSDLGTPLAQCQVANGWCGRGILPLNDDSKWPRTRANHLPSLVLGCESARCSPMFFLLLFRTCHDSRIIDRLPVAICSSVTCVPRHSGSQVREAKKKKKIYSPGHLSLLTCFECESIMASSMV